MGPLGCAKLKNGHFEIVNIVETFWSTPRRLFSSLADECQYFTFGAMGGVSQHTPNLVVYMYFLESLLILCLIDGNTCNN